MGTGRSREGGGTEVGRVVEWGWRVGEGIIFEFQGGLGMDSGCRLSAWRVDRQDCDCTSL